MPQRFGPGSPYIGGRELHLVRNEGHQPADLMVTFLNPASPSGDPGPLPAPPDCKVA
ncbi:MAG: hypothetical protein ACRD2W_19970 [Acidimicrobiales bacterium]